MVAHLAITMPGRAYTARGPALRLPALALGERGATNVAVEYPRIDVIPEDPAWWVGFHRLVADQVVALAREHEPQRVTFVAKSLGTVALANLGPEAVGCPVSAIWVTPLLGLEAVRSGAVRLGWPSLLVAGGGDAAHHPEHHEAVRAALGACSVVLAGADHDLEVPGDVRATLDGFSQLVDAVTSFGRGLP